ncbi:hypothetical protein F4780DRAFT_330637 [Xylariomycetidae sp. FL0641]|nr:hypothetical protein F4780DRAFT_330637 [Xylariomycetidae sp. FL0641]
MYTPTPPPPIPPPKPSSHDASRLGTPTIANSPRPLPGQDTGFGGEASGLIPAPMGEHGGAPPPHPHPAQSQPIPDPGEQWLPKILEDKSKQDLATILGDPALLQALTDAPSAAHPSLAQTRDALAAALDENMRLAGHLAQQEAVLAARRAGTQAQLLAAHALERQWRQKEADMDAALAPFAPAGLYQQLGAALAEQEAVCAALEESFLDGGGGGGGAADGGLATEREVLDWVRRYREAKKLLYLRQERRERWNERRVGGWR